MALGIATVLHHEIKAIAREKKTDLIDDRKLMIHWAGVMPRSLLRVSKSLCLRYGLQRAIHKNIKICVYANC